MRKKKFFTKYLPVAGDIEPGDIAVEPELAPERKFIYQGGIRWYNHRGEIVKLPDWQTRFKFKRLKLFLCASEINVGDEGWFYVKDQFIQGKITAKANGDFLVESGSYVGFTKPIKIVGEIRTVGIKEGLELTEKVADYLTIQGL
jgi:hypothetical protein